MAARLLFLALLLGVMNLVPPGLSTLSSAQAAPGSGMLLSTQAKRPQFRPWSYAPKSEALSAREMSGRLGAARWSPVRRRQDAVIFDNRAGARKAVPVTRGQELGLKFRPDERTSPYSKPSAVEPQSTPPGGTYESEAQSQFRPMRPRRKPTYEELQAETVPVQPPLAPVLPYPALPAPLPPAFGPRWPNNW